MWGGGGGGGGGVFGGEVEWLLLQKQRLKRFSCSRKENAECG